MTLPNERAVGCEGAIASARARSSDDDVELQTRSLPFAPTPSVAPSGCRPRRERRPGLRRRATRQPGERRRRLRRRLDGELVAVHAVRDHPSVVRRSCPLEDDAVLVVAACRKSRGAVGARRVRTCGRRHRRRRGRRPVQRAVARNDPHRDALTAFEVGRRVRWCRRHGRAGRRRGRRRRPRRRCPSTDSRPARPPSVLPT